MVRESMMFVSVDTGKVPVILKNNLSLTFLKVTLNKKKKKGREKEKKRREEEKTNLKVEIS